MARLEQFGCHTCGTPLGWTAPGEARRMNTRAHLFCDECKDKPAELTPRQEDFLTVLRELVARGERPTLKAAADVLGFSNSRAQQIKDAIRARGGTDIDLLLDGPEPELPEPDLRVAQSEVLVRPEVTPDVAARYASLPPIVPVPETPVATDPWEYQQPEYSPSGTPDTTVDPASFGGEFV
jgi:hypothetical protein